MKLSRLLIAIIGLAALLVAYVTGSVLFLALAVIAFIAGLYLMGANRRPPKEREEESAKNKSPRK